MKVKLCWEVGEHYDEVLLEAETEDDLRREIDQALRSRGLDPNRHHCWTMDVR